MILSINDLARTVVLLDLCFESYVLDGSSVEYAESDRGPCDRGGAGLSISLPPSTSAGPACRPKLSYPRQPPGTWLTTTLAATNTPPFIMWSR